MKTLKSLLFLFCAVFIAKVLVACGAYVGGAPSVPYYIESYNMDGTKLIVDGSSNQNDPATYGQTVYTLQSGRRLLVRFENLNHHIESIKNSWDNELHLRLVPSGSTDAETLMGTVKLCPITKNWMMFATWYKAHPFNREGNWASPGADYDAASCIKGEVQLPDGTNPHASPSPSPSPGLEGNLAPKPKPSPTATPYYGHKPKAPSPSEYNGKDQAVIDVPSVIFDIKQWFQSNPEGRSVNYGFILISEKPVQVFGDKSNSYSPRIYWKKPKAYYSSSGGGTGYRYGGGGAYYGSGDDDGVGPIYHR